MTPSPLLPDQTPKRDIEQSCLGSGNNIHTMKNVLTTGNGHETNTDDGSNEADHDVGSEQKLSAAAVFREEFTDFDMHVSFCSTAGDRAHMEDVCVHAHNYFSHCPDSVVRRPYHYFAVFDGHGGRHASEFVSTHLLDFITQQPGFWHYNDDRAVMQAIYDGFLQCHVIMWKHALPTWPLLPNGHRSTAGTTASVAVLRDSKLYIGHVGDSGIVLVERRVQLEPNSTVSSSSTVPPLPLLCAHRLTDDHKPESPEELERIHNAGGSVRVKQGVHRVVWKRPLLVPVAATSQQDLPAAQNPAQYVVKYSVIPFLAVARSLGDFWSFSAESNDFIVSPAPDVSCINMQWPRHRALVIGSDGLWNFCRAEEAVELVEEVDRLREMWFWQIAMMSAADRKRKQQPSSLSSSSTQPRLRRQRKGGRGREEHHRSASQASLSSVTGEGSQHHQRASSLLSLPSVFGDGTNKALDGESRSRHSTGGWTGATNSSAAESDSVHSDTNTNNTGTDDESTYVDDSDDADTTTTTTTDDAESLASLEFQTLQHEANDVNVADCIIHKVLGRCSQRHLRADNIAVFVVLFEPKSSSTTTVDGLDRVSLRSARSDVDDGSGKCTENEKNPRSDASSALGLDTSTVFSTAKCTSDDLTTASSSSFPTGCVAISVNKTELVRDIAKPRGLQQSNEERQNNSEAEAVANNERKEHLLPEFPKRAVVGSNRFSSTKLNGTLYLMRKQLRQMCTVDHRHHRVTKTVSGNNVKHSQVTVNDFVEVASPQNAVDARKGILLPSEKQLAPVIVNRLAEPTTPTGSPRTATAKKTKNRPERTWHSPYRSVRRKKKNSVVFLATKDVENVFLSSPREAVVKYESTIERLHSLLRPPVDHSHAAMVRQQFIGNAVKSTSGVQFYVSLPRSSKNVLSLHRTEELAERESVKSDGFEEEKRQCDDEHTAGYLDIVVTPPPLGTVATPPLKANDFHVNDVGSNNYAGSRRKRILGVSSNAKRKRQQWRGNLRYFRQLHIHNASTFGPKQAVQSMLEQVQAGFSQQHRALFNVNASNATSTAANCTLLGAGTSYTVKNGDCAVADKMSQNATSSAPMLPSFRVMGVKSLKKNSVKPFNVPLSSSIDNDKSVAETEGFTSKFNFLPYQPSPLPLPCAAVVPSTSAAVQSQPTNTTSSSLHRQNFDGSQNSTANWLLPISSAYSHSRSSFAFVTRPAVRPVSSAQPRAPPKH